ncbi:hypothetical protein Rhal01_00623 [Rubritalea halochordaticola]|uniref:LamG-like jellyroll fold domain-containing protein n=1 Tax=Rubritalea halochordaticola TaxID=714537 RepID=A0ABP9UZI9_9BACT
MLSRSLYSLLIIPLLSGCDSEPASKSAPLEAASSVNPSQSGELISYNFHVRPILSDKCFFCHGPDEKNNKAGLRLDTPAHAYTALKESKGFGIIPGDPKNSVILHRINSSDPEEVMPPPESKLDLTEEEISILSQWIEQGANYEPHWAFTPLTKEIPVPESESSWARQDIDHFILKTLSEHQLSPSPDSPHWQWLRRASLDLTGLPPTEQEIERFLKVAEQPGAYEAAVDRLLSSPAYGEHMATPWLDAARYADSYGYQSDQLSVTWPYRDWVIRAFNDNLPYDKFITYNLAGDLLENPTRDQKLATAYNRLHRMTNEGGSIREEFLAEHAADRVHTMGTAMLGLTMECARCHDHKYDPITQRDYFSLTAYFNSIGENGLYDHASKIPSPSMLLPTEQQEAQLQASRKELKTLEKQTKAIEESQQSAFEGWLSSSDKTPEIPDLVGYFPLDSDNSGTLRNMAPGADKDAKQNGLKAVSGKIGGAIKLNGDTGITIPKFHRADRWQAITHSLWLMDTKRDELPVVVMQRTFGTDVGYNGHDLMLQDGFLEARWYRVWPGNAIGVRTKEPIKKSQWHQVTWTYDGSSTASGIRIFLDGAEVATEVLADGPMIKNIGQNTYGSGDYTLGQRFRDRGFAGGLVDEFRIYSRDLSPVEVQQLYNGSALQEAIHRGDKDLLAPYYFSALNSATRQHTQALQQARHSLVKNQDVCTEVAIMKDTKIPTTAYLLERGEYDAPKTTPVPRATPHFLPPISSDYPVNRLGLAMWMTSPDHPLTSRVFVNRIWQQFFGRGIVKSTENFGVQGDLPSHPELLDWLARDFVNHNWDIKRLCKQIVLSSTYRQSSRASKELLEQDPENILLARGPAYRLDAELIRDTALSASGLLIDKQGGPPVSPYQPGGDLWRESNSMSPAFRRGKGEALYRRSIYSVWKRTAPFPNMLAFDATSREVCTVKRARTNTPLQALVLLNDTQFVEACRALAEKHLTSSGLNIESAFISLTGRHPSTEETKILKDLYTEQLEHFTSDTPAAEKLINIGDSKASTSHPAANLAAATIVVQTIFNLDATIWKR